MKSRTITDISVILPQRLLIHVYISFAFYLFYLAKKNHNKQIKPPSNLRVFTVKTIRYWLKTV